MKRMQIFEPAMCCPTGLCGVSVDPELLRISTVLSTLEKNGIKVERYNLSNAPQEFIKNKAVNVVIKEQGVEVLPLTVLDGEIIITGRYPKNDEFVKYLNVSDNYLGEELKVEKASIDNCGCSCCSDVDVNEGCSCSEENVNEGCSCSSGDVTEGCSCSSGDGNDGCCCSDGDGNCC